MKAVHKAATRNEKVYKCFGTGCSKPDKIWPRRDNFKQHLEKMHKEEDYRELLKRCVYFPSGNSPALTSDRSEEWYKLRPLQSPSMDPGIVEEVAQPTSFNTPLTLGEHFDVFRTPLTESTTSYTSAPSGGSDMIRSSSYNTSSHGASVPPFTPHLRGGHGRSVSGPINNNQPGALFSQTLNGPGNLRIPQTPARRPRSVVEHPQVRSPQLEQTDFAVQSDPSINLFLASPTAFHPEAGMQSQYSSLQTHRTAQPRPTKKAQTVACSSDPWLRNSEFLTPSQPQTIPQEIRRNQEEYLQYVGAETATNPSHQGYPVDVGQKLHKRLEVEINAFLAGLKAKSSNLSLDDDEVYEQFALSRLTLASTGTATSYDTSSVAPASAAPKHRAKSIHCPVTQNDYFVCPICQKPKNRQSDLNKHLQRHVKPFGCVFDHCTKTFGSKNDWTRHENTQHRQQECWRCHLCSQVFFGDCKYYLHHMHSKHRTQLTESPEELAPRHRIAQNNQGRFWCGFCEKIIAHSKTDVEAVKLRFDHIAYHFTKENKVSKNWVELSGWGKTKRQLEEQRNQIAMETELGDNTENALTANGGSRTPSSHFSQSSSQRTTVEPNADDFDRLATVRDQEEILVAGAELQSIRYPRARRRVVCCGCDNEQRVSYSGVCMNPECLHSFGACCDWALGHDEEID
jgi:hypothetical protein